jgi:hypothetical protein
MFIKTNLNQTQAKSKASKSDGLCIKKGTLLTSPPWHRNTKKEGAREWQMKATRQMDEVETRHP